MSACPFIVSRILDYAISPSPPVPWDVPSERLHRGPQLCRYGYPVSR